MRAARYKMPLMLAIIGGDPRCFAPDVELHQRTLAQSGIAALPIGVYSPGHIADTDAAAHAQLWPAYREMRDRIGAERAWGPTNRAEFDREIDSGSLCGGRPETVAYKIAATERALGLARFDMKYSEGALAHDIMMRSTELYGTLVIPRVRALLGGEQ